MNEFSAKIYGEPFIDIPKDLYIPPDALEIFLYSFEGPLDLLLYLIKKQGIDILDIPMYSLTKQYLAYIDQIRDNQFELAGEYLLMAAMLIEIKTRMLLPKSNAINIEDDPRAELVRRLISYEAIKKAAIEIDKLPVVDKDFWISDIYTKKSQELPANINLQDIVDAFKKILSRQDLFHTHQIIKEQLSVREYIAKTLKYLQAYKNADFLVMIKNNDIQSTQVIIIYFLAVLELVKEGLLTFTQSKSYSKIYLNISYESS